MEIKQAIERCKEIIKKEHSGWFGILNQEAIETVLAELKKLQKKKRKIRKGNSLFRRRENRQYRE